VRPEPALDTQERIALAMQEARMRMMVDAVNAAANQMSHEVQAARLLLNVESPEMRVLQAGMAAASVTVATLLADRVVNAFSKRVDDIHRRLDILEERIRSLPL